MGYRPRFRSSSDWRTPALIVSGAILLALLTILGLYFWLTSTTGRRMWLILQHNVLFWILLGGGVAWGGFCKWKWPSASWCGPTKSSPRHRRPWLGSIETFRRIRHTRRGRAVRLYNKEEKMDETDHGNHRSSSGPRALCV